MTSSDPRCSPSPSPRLAAVRLPHSFIEFLTEIVAGDGLRGNASDAAAAADAAVVDESGSRVRDAAVSCFLVRPCCPHDLSSLITFKRKVPTAPSTLLDDATVKRMTWELLSAVAKLHGRNILHRAITR